MKSLYEPKPARKDGSRYPEEDIGHHRTVRINQQLQAPDIALNHAGMPAKKHAAKKHQQMQPVNSKRPMASLRPLVRATNIHSLAAGPLGYHTIAPYEAGPCPSHSA
jgi:hypothetical protein